MSNYVVILVDGGDVQVDFMPEDVGVMVFDLNANDTYLYKGVNYCQFVRSNGDGTVDVRCVDSSDGKMNNKLLMRVPVEDLEFFASGDDDDLLEEEDEDYG